MKIGRIKHASVKEFSKEKRNRRKSREYWNLIMDNTGRLKDNWNNY